MPKHPSQHRFLVRSRAGKAVQRPSDSEPGGQYVAALHPAEYPRDRAQVLDAATARDTVTTALGTVAVATARRTEGAAAGGPGANLGLLKLQNGSRLLEVCDQ